MSKILLGELETVRAQYDEHAKSILSNRYILAWIMKETVEEFQDLSVEQIAAECIGEEVEISAAAVSPGQTNEPKIPEKIIGDSTESTIRYEGKVTYDIRFHAYTPKEKGRQKILFDMEAQKRFYPGYEIVTRGILYGARMISAQVNTEFTLNDYDGIKKVYSIWICMNAPSYIGNAVSKFITTKIDLKAGIPDKPDCYDKITVIQIALNRNAPDQANSVTRLLNILFSEEMPVKQKEKLLAEEYGIQRKDSQRKELSKMCNLSEGIYERGIEKGMEKGSSIQLVNNVEQVMKNLQISLDRACEILGTTITYYNQSKSHLL